jgi:spermidine synthase
MLISCAVAALASRGAARNRFIEVGRDVRPTPDVRRMLAQVRQSLLSVLRISPEFRPAYDPLLRMAAALSDSDTVAARALLVELQNAQPSRPEAAQALRNLSGASQ